MTNEIVLFQRSGYDLDIHNLCKTYTVGREAYRALDRINCRIVSGQVTIVQGPSGCGKTTLLNILGGVDIASDGSVTAGKITLTNFHDERKLANYRLHDVGFVFQAFNLIPGLSALDNLQLPMTITEKNRERRVDRSMLLLELVGLKMKARKKPEELSSGEQQRVAIALALANDPPLILADEPTGNLDSRNASLVIDLLCSLAHDYGKTVVVTTHDTVVGARGDKCLNIRDGALERDSPDI